MNATGLNLREKEFLKKQIFVLGLVILSALLLCNVLNDEIMVNINNSGSNSSQSSVSRGIIDSNTKLFVENQP